MEAPQAYSSELVGGWLSHLSREFVGHDFEGQSEYDFIQPRLAPETPGSLTTSDTSSTHSSNYKSVLINPWLSEVFEQSRFNSVGGEYWSGVCQAGINCCSHTF